MNLNSVTLYLNAMANPVLKWALQVLQQPDEIHVTASVSEALGLVGIDSNQIEVNSQSLESIFSTIGEHTSSVIEKRMPWQALNVRQIVYPTENADVVPLDIPVQYLRVVGIGFMRVKTLHLP